VWSLLQMDIIQCHLRSLPIPIYVPYHYYLQLLPNIHILEIYERACVNIEGWNPLLFYVYSLSHQVHNRNYEYQTECNLATFSGNE
jgi:hypothetical protein